MFPRKGVCCAWVPVAVALVIALACFARAEFNEEVRPKAVPGAAGGEVRGRPLPPVEGSEKVLVEKLVGVVFVTSVKDVEKDGVRVSGIQARGLPLLQAPEFQQRIAPYLGQPATMRRLNRLAQEVVIYYRDQGRPVVDVVLPEQDITTGTVQYVVIEGSVGQVRAEGNQWFGDDLLLSHIRLEPGTQIRTRTLREDVEWLNRNPFRQVDVLLSPGAEEGLVDLLLQVEDIRPYRFYTGYENTGNDLTGSTRWLAGFNWGNAFLPDAQLNYQFSSSSEFDRLRAHAVSYMVPLPWRHIFTIYGSRVDSDVEDMGLEIDGDSTQIGVRYDVPLPPWEGPACRYRHEMGLGFDYKRSDTDVQFGVLRPLDTTTEIGQFVIGYRAVEQDRRGQTTLDANGYYNPGSIFTHTSDHEFAAVRARAEAEYAYARLEAERLTYLSKEERRKGWLMHNEFAAQVSNRNLLPSEQLGYGGYYSIRGFEPRALPATDQGWYLRNELHTPAMHIAPHLMIDHVEDDLRFLAFFDYGIAQRHKDIAGQEGRVTMSSFGAGLRYRASRRAQVRVDYAIPWHDPNETDGRDRRWHLGLLITF